MNTPIDVSVIVPTWCEAENLVVLIPKIITAIEATPLTFEIIVVDDNSPDDTSAICAEFARHWPVRLITRTEERGLASAVLCGMHAGTGETLLVMDADLSHPPGAIPLLVRGLHLPGYDFAIGSRYVQFGSIDSSWTWFRQVNSRIATALARGLTNAQDPLAGFFAIRKSCFVQARDIQPLGYKIGLELIVRCQCRNIYEEPIHFTDRTLGESKLDFRQQWLYLKHLAILYRVVYPGLTRMVSFGGVGLSGALIDILMFVVLAASLPLSLGRGLAIVIAMTWNFVLNRQFTFVDCERGTMAVQYLRFCASCLVGGTINWAVTLSLCSVFNWFDSHPGAAAIPGILAGAAANYIACCRWVFGRSRNRHSLPGDSPDQPSLDGATASQRESTQLPVSHQAA